MSGEEADEVTEIAEGETLSGHGDYDGTVVNNGNVSPGNSPGIQTFTNYTQASGATLTIEIGGTTAGTGYDQIQVSGAASLDGTLQVSLINGFVPKPGDTFDIVTFGSVSGKFADGKGMFGFGDGNLFFEILPLADKLQLIAVEIPGGVAINVADQTTRDSIGKLFNSHYFPFTQLNFSGSINLSNFFHLNGSFSLQASPVVNVDIATGLPANLTALADSIIPADIKSALQSISGIAGDFSAITDLASAVFSIGATNVNAFVGYGTPDL